MFLVGCLQLSVSDCICAGTTSQDCYSNEVAFAPVPYTTKRAALAASVTGDEDETYSSTFRPVGDCYLPACLQQLMISAHDHSPTCAV